MKKIFFAIAIVQTCYAGPIQVIGRTSNSKYILGQMSSEEYVQTLTTLKNSLDTQVVNNLNNYVESSTTWQLQKFSLGLGANGEIGVGPFKFGTALKQRFVYSR